eukprot:scaffold1959_cov403-Prasinococcus_capsulatus_cf.AAC.2
MPRRHPADLGCASGAGRQQIRLAMTHICALATLQRPLVRAGAHRPCQLACRRGAGALRGWSAAA